MSISLLEGHAKKQEPGTTREALTMILKSPTFAKSNRY